MRRLRWSVLLVTTVLVAMATAAEAQITVTVEKQIEAGSDQMAVFDFPGVGMLGNGQSATYMFGPGGVSLLFEQPPDGTWSAPTIDCTTMGQVTAVVSGPFEVTITDQSGGLSAGSVECTYVNRQAPVIVPTVPPGGLIVLALALISGGFLVHRRFARQ